MEITFSTEKRPTPDQVIDLYNNAGLPRPTTDHERIKIMYENSNLVITAWDGERLIGVSRCLTDWVWSCYLADLAVHTDYQGKSIGRQLIDLTRKTLGDQSTVLLLSVPAAMEYYPKVGMEKVENGFIFHRKK